MEVQNDRRIGLIADVHSNLQALHTVLLHLENITDVIYCLGDIVGYGGEPAACVEIVRDRCRRVVQGNHDRAVAEPGLRNRFNPHAREAVERQEALLEPSDIEWLAELPPVIELDDLVLGHSGFRSPESYEYVFDAAQARVEFDAIRAPLGAIGHTHVVSIFVQSPRGEVTLRSGADLVPAGRETGQGSSAYRPDERLIVNPGAVGQPRDRDPRAACAVIDVGARVIEVSRLPYDVTAAQDAIRRNGMPLFEAGRLAMGL